MIFLDFILIWVGFSFLITCSIYLTFWWTVYDNWHVTTTAMSKKCGCNSSFIIIEVTCHSSEIIVCVECYEFIHLLLIIFICHMLTANNCPLSMFFDVSVVTLFYPSFTLKMSLIDFENFGLMGCHLSFMWNNFVTGWYGIRSSVHHYFARDLQRRNSGICSGFDWWNANR